LILHINKNIVQLNYILYFKLKFYNLIKSEEHEEMKIKVMTIFGTRPEAIKMAPLVKELNKRKETECIICVTAQHREMLDQVLETFEIVPDYDLNIMRQGQTLADVTTRALNGLESIIKEVKPNIVLVHGDTTSQVRVRQGVHRHFVIFI
jgi:UDP-N-acetylglucosamine 2-epimerase